MGWYVGVYPNGRTLVFQTKRKPSREGYPELDYVLGPFTSQGNADDIAVEIRLMQNPIKNKNVQGSSLGTVIYDNIDAIEATKGKSSLWPEEKFRHDFKKGAQVIGLPNGDILIKSTKGRRLWKNFKYKRGQHGS